MKSWSNTVSLVIDGIACHGVTQKKSDLSADVRFGARYGFKPDSGTGRKGAQQVTSQAWLDSSEAAH